MIGGEVAGAQEVKKKKKKIRAKKTTNQPPSQRGRVGETMSNQ